MSRLSRVRLRARAERSARDRPRPRFGSKRRRALRRARAGALLAAAWGAGLLAGSCGAGPRPESEGGPRLIEDDPETVFAPGLLAAGEVFVWDFADPASLAEWAIPDPAAGPRTDRLGFTLEDPAGPFRMWRVLGVEAGEIDFVDVELHGSLAGALTLSWSHPGGELEPEQSIELALATRRGWKPELGVYRFRVGAHPRWRGAIDRLAIGTLKLAPGFRIGSLRGLGSAAPAERLGHIAQRAFKVDLGDELRNARIGIPGQPIEWDAEVPSGARLRFAYGAPAASLRSVEFRVAASRPGGPARQLFRARLGEGGQGTLAAGTRPRPTSLPSRPASTASSSRSAPRRASIRGAGTPRGPIRRSSAPGPAGEGPTW